MTDTLLKTAIERYLRTKELIILAEECDSDFCTFLQPYFEINRGFDHLARVEVARLGINNDDDCDEFYVKENIRKATGHFYRAAYDVLDWLSMSLRESITGELRPFSAEAINAVVPEYYNEVRPQLVQISQKIAEIRGKKDVGRDEIVHLVDVYEDQVRGLMDKLVMLRSKISGLMEYEAKLKKRNRKKIVWQFVIGFILVAVGWLLRSFANLPACKSP